MSSSNPPTEGKARPSLADRGARFGVPVVLLLAALGFARFYGDFYPIEEWLFWRYAIYWLACTFWSFGCVSTGYVLVRGLRGVSPPLLETLCLSFGAGMVVFYLAMNALGAVHGLHVSTFFALPLVMIAVGARPLVRLLRRYVHHVRYHASAREARSVLQSLIWIFGLLVLAMIYFKMLTPENAQFDSRWKHLALAEQYAHLGFIPRFGEGWTVATNPHLASMLYTWAFLLPKARLFDQVELAAHMEFTCLLWTLATIPAAVRLLVPGTRAGSSWAARFLFPGVLLYDSSLACGADHIAAFFALPIFICLLRALPDLKPGRCALLGLMMAGAAMPKLTAGIFLIPVPALVVAAVFVWRSIRERRVLWKGPAAATVVALGATAFFWLRNWVWYGDPLYPSLHEFLTLRPWTPDSANLFEWGYKNFQFWRPAEGWEGIKAGLKAMFTFSFLPHDYARYHGKVPVFGSLFTLLLLCLPFFRRTKRIWGLAIMTLIAIFSWYMLHHQDRYLQALVPWMAAITAAIIIRIWSGGWAAKATVAFLVATQIVIGADVYFIQSHAMIGAPIKRANDLLAAGYKKKYEERLQVFKSWVAIREALPEDAHVLLHDNHVHLGLSRRTTSDWGTWQYGISYGRLASPREAWQLYRDLGVTHVVWKDLTSKGYDSLAGDLVFFDFALRRTHAKKKVSGHWVAGMPEEQPTGEPYGKVAFWGCNDKYESGLYDLSQMTTPVFGPERARFPKPLVAAEAVDVGSLLEQADYAVVDPKCAQEARTQIEASSFEIGAKRPRANPGSRVKWLLYFRP
jgi:hypothetical protein